MKSKYFFEDVNDLIAYLYTFTNSISPLKLQKGLYFLYAYYSAMYGSNDTAVEREVEYNLPQELFPAKFEAWNYGPVIRSVYSDRRQGEENFLLAAEELDVESLFSTETYGKEVKSFIDDLFNQIKLSSDFSLVDRSHADRSWINAFEQGQSTTINNQDIINEYKSKFARKQ